MMPAEHNSRRRRNRPVQEFVESNFALDRKIKEACKDVLPNVQWSLMELPRDEDKELIADFLLNWSSESADGMPMAPNTKRGYINALVYLARYHDHGKSFKDMTKEDIIDGYLHSLKRDFSQDIEQKWVNTYNNRATKYLAFWKWMTQPDLRREERQLPPQLKGLRFAKRKNKTHVKREDHWTDEEHKVFLEKCEDLRLACFHAIAKDTGGRPGELLDLKISDLKIITSTSTGKKYAEFWIGRKGKMKKGRPVSISDAIPYFNVWVSVHPLRDSQQGAYLFPSRENKAKYRNIPLKPDSLRLAYVRTIEELFPKLLDRPDISLEDKMALKSLIYDKPHYPYLRRHEFSTEWAPRLPQQTFNQLLGHSKNSRMYDVYVQDLGTEGNKELLIAKGIIDREETVSKAQIAIQAKPCPVCHEMNKQNAKLCFKCNFIISPEGYLEMKDEEAKAIQDAESTKKMLAALEQKTATIQASMEDYRERFEEELALHNRRIIQHAIEVRKRKGGETNVKLTEQDVEDILTEAMYEDYKHLQQEEQHAG